MQDTVFLTLVPLPLWTISSASFGSFIPIEEIDMSIGRHVPTSTGIRPTVS